MTQSTTPTLNEQIQQFYDVSTGLWEAVWGPHLHHGYYGPSGRYKRDRKTAQVALIEELLAWSGVTTAENILDSGCGVGGSTLHLAEKYHANATGITLSPFQANRGKERAIAAGLQDKVEFAVMNALETDFPDNHFDLVWSLESAEHIADKAKLFQECYRVLKPGGKLVLATWCHRPTTLYPLSTDEKQHLAEIYRVYYLPPVVSLPDLTETAKQAGFNTLQTDDWSMAVAPFWDVVIQSIFDPKALVGLLQADWKTLEGAFVLPLMSQGYKRGLVRFGVLSGRKDK